MEIQGIKYKFNNIKRKHVQNVGQYLKKKRLRKVNVVLVEIGGLLQTEETQQLLTIHDWKDPGQEKAQLQGHQ